MGHPGPRRRALLERHKAIRAKLSPTELPALETALATPQQSSRGAITWGHKRPRTCLGRGAQQQLSMDQQQLQGAQHQLAEDQQQLQDAQHQLSLNQQELQGAQHQLAQDQQQLQDAQRQVALDQQQLQGAQHQLAVDLEQLQGTQHQLAQALEQMQSGRTGLERSELLLRQHMDACMRAPTMDLPSYADMQPCSHAAMHGDAQPCNLPCNQPCTTMQPGMQPAMQMHSHAQPCTAMHSHAQPCTTMQPEMRRICYMRNRVPSAAAQAAYFAALPPDKCMKLKPGVDGSIMLSVKQYAPVKQKEGPARIKLQQLKLSLQRLTVERPTEIQSDHWHHHNVGIFVACAYFRNNRDEYREEAVYILTDGKDQSAAVTQAALHQVLDYLQGERCMVMKQLCMWSDGCAAQFKGTPALQLHRRMAMRYRVSVWWSYGATSHFKGRHDSEGGVFKHSMAARVLADHPDLSAECKAQQLAGVHNVECVVPAAQLAASVAHQTRGSVQRRWCLVLKDEEVEKCAELDPDAHRLLRTITGSRAMHAMFFPADGVAPMWSETACACVRHMGSKPQQCMCHGASTLSSIPMFGRVTLASDKKEDAECLRLLHARAPHIASAHMTLNVHLLKEYARECLGWKGKRLTQKKPLLRADILEHLRWEQEMEEDQLAEVGVDEADEMDSRRSQNDSHGTPNRCNDAPPPMLGRGQQLAEEEELLDEFGLDQFDSTSTPVDELNAQIATLQAQLVAAQANNQQAGSLDLHALVAPTADDAIRAAITNHKALVAAAGSERLTVERPTEIQSDHWHHHNVGIFVACAYFRNNRDEYREEAVYILTDGKDQSAAVTQAALHQVLDYLQGERCMVMKQLCMWSDGCAAQFKGTPALQLHRRMAMRYRVSVWWSYGATSHFKGRHDSEGGVFKHSMAARVLADHPDLSAECKAQQLAGVHNVECVVPAAQLAASVAHQTRGSVQRRWCLVLKDEEVEKCAELDPDAHRLLRTITGSRAMHAMFFPADGVAPMWSETACACVRHMGSKPQQCMCHGASTLSSIPMFGRVTLASDKKEDAECLRLLHARAPHIASAHMTLNVHLLKEYARECLGWKGKRLTQKKPLLRADILEHLRWEQEMEEDQLAEVGVDEADEMDSRRSQNDSHGTPNRCNDAPPPMLGRGQQLAEEEELLDEFGLDQFDSTSTPVDELNAQIATLQAQLVAAQANNQQAGSLDLHALVAPTADDAIHAAITNHKALVAAAGSGNDWLNEHEAVMSYQDKTLSLACDKSEPVVLPCPSAGVSQSGQSAVSNPASFLVNALRAKPPLASAKVAARWLRKGGTGVLALITVDNSSTPDPAPAEPDLPPGVSQALNALLDEYADVFAPITSLPPERPVGHAIPLVPDARPSVVPQYRMSQDEHAELKKQVQDLLAKGMIEPSSSPFAAPILFVKKKSGELRMCLDYRQLNKITIRDQYPLPRIDDLFDKLSGCTVFSSLDLQAGYNQIRITPEDVPKTAFRTPDGHYQFKVLSFGLCNAPATFQRVMNDAFAPVLNQCALVYLDDILVMSKSVDEHLKHLRKVFDLLRLNKLFAKQSKCEFMRTTLKFLGHVIFAGAIAVDPEKIKSISSWPVPQTLQQLQSFLGAANFVRKFVHNFSVLAAPLTDLCGKAGDSFLWHNWPADELKAFASLKAAVAQVPMLRLPDHTQPFQVYCDASLQGVGAVLMQDGYPLAYLSKKLSSAERNYTTGEQELLALITACKEWRCYLEGVPFALFTDHKPLTALPTQKVLSRRQARWMEFLSRFTFDLQYLPGDANPADPLSRIPAGPQDCAMVCVVTTRRQAKQSLERGEVRVAQALPQVPPVGTPSNAPTAVDALAPRPTVSDNPVAAHHSRLPELEAPSAADTSVHYPAAPAHPLQLADHLVHGYRLDPAFTAEADLPGMYMDDHGLWRRTGKGTVMVPNDPELREYILHEMHDAAYAGHVGITKTLERLSRVFYWDTMRADVRHYVTTCDACQRDKSSTLKPGGLLNPLSIPDYRWESVSMDLITKLPSASHGFDAICVFVDRLSKMVHFVPCKESMNAKGFARLFVDNVFKLHGLPKDMVSDRGPHFHNTFWHHVQKLLGMRGSLSSSYHPQSDGQTERYNRVLEEMLRHYISPTQADWPDYLSLAEFPVNNSWQESIKSTPFLVNTGQSPITPMLHSLPDKGRCPEGLSYATWWQEAVAKAKL
ncbi:hypothetical protein QJQ45_001918 [Haematococcus lacustris]|nr:hypothetical protein QJQ45_001918 [Haematococcus lacustris]